MQPSYVSCKKLPLYLAILRNLFLVFTLFAQALAIEMYLFAIWFITVVQAPNVLSLVRFASSYRLEWFYKVFF